MSLKVTFSGCAPIGTFLSLAAAPVSIRATQASAASDFNLFVFINQCPGRRRRMRPSSAVIPSTLTHDKCEGNAKECTHDERIPDRNRFDGPDASAGGCLLRRANRPRGRELSD